MSNCDYCDLRVKPDSEGRESPHKHGCPGLEIEMLRDEIEQLQFELNVAKEREEIDNTESRLANERIADLEASLDVCASELRSWVESPGSTPTLADFKILDTVEKILKRNPMHAEWGVHDFSRSETTKDSDDTPLTQANVLAWVRRAFGEACATDTEERGSRLVEEAVEAAQACGVRRGKIDAIADRVYLRPVGELPQEIGGTLITVYALAECCGIDMQAEGLKEWRRICSLPQSYWDRKHAEKYAAGTALPAPEKDAHPTVVPVNDGEYYECSKCRMELWPDQRDNGLRLECGNCGAEWWEYEPILPEQKSRPVPQSKSQERRFAAQLPEQDTRTAKDICPHGAWDARTNTCIWCGMEKGDD